MSRKYPTATRYLSHYQVCCARASEQLSSGQPTRGFRLDPTYLALLSQFAHCRRYQRNRTLSAFHRATGPRMNSPDA
jgi:hypothetical protein